MKQNLKRARQLFLLLALGTVPMLSENLAAQTCAVPLSLTVNDCDAYNVNDTVAWFSFNSGSAASWCTISVTATGGSASITGAELYTGTCTSLTLVQSGYNDIEGVVIRSGVSSSTNYLVKVTRSNSASGQMNVCTNITSTVGSCPPCPDSLCQLICNHDLELYPNTPAGQAPANFVSTNVCGNWGTPGVGTPDYFSVNFTAAPTTVDTTNFAGTEAPHSGNFYGGLYCYYNTNALYREYIQHQLTTPLVAGEFYTLTFWVSLADCSGFAVNDLGAYFSVAQPIQAPNPSVLNFTPQIVAGTTITDTSTWTMITGTFQSAGGEQWITIGSFGNAPQTQTAMPAPLPTPPFPNAVNTNPNLGAYYYIDDITLEIYPDPEFTWSGTCKIKFVDSTECIDTGYVHHWNFGDPASGANDSSALQNPQHTFTQNGIPYTVTHTITSPYGAVFTYTATVIQQGDPVANIDGYQTNNCGNGFMTYTANLCQPGIVYSWIVNGGTPDTTGGCSININWGANGGYVVLAAFDTLNDCTGHDTLYIPACCNLPTLYTISNTSASAVLSSPAFASCVTSPNTIDGPCSGNDILISGVFTIDVPLTFLNCDYISLSPNAVIIVDPGQTLTLDNCTLSVKCDTMWDGIYLTNVTSTLNMINGTVLQQAKNGVVSNSGGKYFIENSKFVNNYRDMQVNAYSGTHPGVVRNTNFTMAAPGFWPAIPALPAYHTRTVCAIEIVDNADITIGDPTLPVYRNNFTNIFVGVRSTKSRTKVLNNRFANFNPSAQQILNVPNAGSGVVGIGGKNAYLYQPSLTVGAAGITYGCAFVNTRIAVDAMDELHVTVENNNINDTRQFGVRVQRCGQKLISVIDTRINNASVSYGFNTGILVLECYDATVNISRNRILQTGNTAGNYSQQTGTGIRVALATPGDMFVNIVGNNSINRVKTGILVQNLIGKNKVNITDNVINFAKPNAAYTSVHSGIRLQNCATVKVRYNAVNKGAGAPVQSMDDKLRGVSMENSTVTVISHNVFTRMGSGVYGWELCGGSSMVCDTFKGCYDGFLFRGGPSTNGACDIGDQVIDQTSGNPAPTGCVWYNSGFADITGKIDSVYWYCDPLNFPSTGGLALGSLLPSPPNLPTISLNTSACDLPQYFAPQAPVIEREQNAGQAVFNEVSYAVNSEQGYQGKRNAHRKLRANPTWMSIGTPQDSAYTGFYMANDQTNVGLFRNFEEMAAVDSVQAAGNILASIADSNNSESNLKVVYSIYQQTWMQGIYEFSPSDSAVLYGLAIQYASDAGEAVYSARVLLGLDVDEYGASSERYANTEEAADIPVQAMTLYPNPVNDQLTINTTFVEGKSTAIVITDLQGKAILTQNITVSGQMVIDVSTLDNGMYFVQMVVDGELIETNKLEVIHE